MNIDFGNLPFFLLGGMVVLIIFSVLFLKPKIPKKRMPKKPGGGRWWDAIFPKDWANYINSNFLMGLIEWIVFVFAVMFIAPKFWEIWWGDIWLFVLSNVVVLVLLTGIFRNNTAVKVFATALIIITVAILANFYLEKAEDQGLVSSDGWLSRTEASVPMTEGEWTFRWYRTAEGAAKGRTDEGRPYPAKIIAYSPTKTFIWTHSFRHNGRNCTATFAWDKPSDPSQGKWYQGDGVNCKPTKGSWSTTDKGVTDEGKDYFIGWHSDRKGKYHFRLVRK